ncbi:MAG TPA: hypothetical protein DHV14_09340, partial [Micrococcales bacterium]|nr:hypothetical protein [Micrococcales bacterium]
MSVAPDGGWPTAVSASSLAPGLSECVSRLRVVVGEVVAAAGVARAAAAADPGVGAAAVGALAVLDEVATVLGVARA